jgi:hypothetical protein
MRGQTPDRSRHEEPPTGWSVGILVVGAVIALHLGLALVIGISRPSSDGSGPVAPAAEACPGDAVAAGSEPVEARPGGDGDAAGCARPASPTPSPTPSPEPSVSTSSGRPGY